MSFLDDLGDEDEPKELVPAPAVSLRRKSAEEKQLDRLRAREDRILEKALATVEDVGGARDIDDQHDGTIPDEWIAEVGLVEAGKRLRVAMDSRRNKKEAPVYLEHMRATALGIIKARSSQPAPDISLNFNMTIAAPQSARPIIDIDVDDEK